MTAAPDPIPLHAGEEPPSAPLLVIGGHSRAAIAFRQLCSDQGRPVRIVVRRVGSLQAGEEACVVDDYGDLPSEAFAGVDTALNFTGATHAPTPQALWALNVGVPMAAATQLKRRGGRRFIQVSSLSVYGGAEDISRTTEVAPTSAYGRSKAAADAALAKLRDDRFEVIIVRAPLIYGPQGGGKLEQLMALLRRTRWMPAPAKLEPRSMVHVDNLAMGLAEILTLGPSGLAFVADPEPFRLDRLAEVMSAAGSPVRLTRLPFATFALVRAVAPGFYESLYGRSLIHPGDTIDLPGHARSLSQGLLDVLRTRT